MRERPRGMQRALAGFEAAWGMTATCFRRQQQHFTRLRCSRILKVKIWLKCAAIDWRLAGRAFLNVPSSLLLWGRERSGQAWSGRSVADNSYSRPSSPLIRNQTRTYIRHSRKSQTEHRNHERFAHRRLPKCPNLQHQHYPLPMKGRMTLVTVGEIALVCKFVTRKSPVGARWPSY